MRNKDTREARVYRNEGINQNEEEIKEGKENRRDLRELGRRKRRKRKSMKNIRKGEEREFQMQKKSGSK